MTYNFQELSRREYPNSSFKQSIIRIDIDDKHYDIDLMLNHQTKQVNLTKMMSSIKKAFNIGENKKTLTNCLQFQHIIKFLDELSLRKYGHVHFTYDQGAHNLYDVDNLDSNQFDLYNINKRFITKGKFCANKDLLDKNDELISDIMVGGNIKGKLADYEVIEPVVIYTLPEYKFIARDFTTFVGNLFENVQHESIDQDDLTVNSPTITPQELKAQLLKLIDEERKEINTRFDQLKKSIIEMFDELNTNDS